MPQEGVKRNKERKGEAKMICTVQAKRNKRAELKEQRSVSLKNLEQHVRVEENHSSLTSLQWTHREPAIQVPSPSSKMTCLNSPSRKRSIVGLELVDRGLGSPAVEIGSESQSLANKQRRSRRSRSKSCGRKSGVNSRKERRQKRSGLCSMSSHSKKKPQSASPVRRAKVDVAAGLIRSSSMDTEDMGECLRLEQTSTVQSKRTTSGDKVPDDKSGSRRTPSNVPTSRRRTRRATRSSLGLPENDISLHPNLQQCRTGESQTDYGSDSVNQELAEISGDQVLQESTNSQLSRSAFHWNDRQDLGELPLSTNDSVANERRTKGELPVTILNGNQSRIVSNESEKIQVNEASSTTWVLAEIDESFVAELRAMKAVRDVRNTEKIGRRKNRRSRSFDDFTFEECKRQGSKSTKEKASRVTHTHGRGSANIYAVRNPSISRSRSLSPAVPSPRTVPSLLHRADERHPLQYSGSGDTGVGTKDDKAYVTHKRRLRRSGSSQSIQSSLSRRSDHSQSSFRSRKSNRSCSSDGLKSKKREHSESRGGCGERTDVTQQSRTGRSLTRRSSRAASRAGRASSAGIADTGLQRWSELSHRVKRKQNGSSLSRRHFLARSLSRKSGTRNSIYTKRVADDAISRSLRSSEGTSPTAAPRRQRSSSNGSLGRRKARQAQPLRCMEETRQWKSERHFTGGFQKEMMELQGAQKSSQSLLKARPPRFPEVGSRNMEKEAEDMETAQRRTAVDMKSNLSTNTSPAMSEPDVDPLESLESDFYPSFQIDGGNEAELLPKMHRSTAAELYAVGAALHASLSSIETSLSTNKKETKMSSLLGRSKSTLSKLRRGGKK